jgi:hypothetical protein
MFRFLKKSPIYPTESKWTVLRGKRGGRPIFVRRNDSAKQLRGHAKFSSRVGIAVPLQAANEHGLPGSEEAAQLDTIEDLLCSRLQENQESLLVLAITTGGMREFVFYTRRRASETQSIIEKVKGEVHSHELQCYIADDPAWSIYDEFAS